MDKIAGGNDLEAIRDRVVDQATGHVLEIGSGTGANFLSYADSITSLTTVDPNPGMNRRARQRIKFVEFPVDSRELSCEELPMKDASFDCVVSTLTMCSLENLGDCLSEIYRVLKPGGRLLFLEHGVCQEAKVSKWQRRLTPLQCRLFVGCRLDRSIDGAVREAGFEIAHLDTYFLPNVPKAMGFMYEGVATK